MELRQLRYFVAVAKNESFKKAAIELRIAQPALSRQIGLLEHELRTPLFTRHTRGSIPTEEGRLLLEEAERILHLTEQAKQKLLFHRSVVSGPVGIGLAPTLAEWIAPDMLQQLRDELTRGESPLLRGVDTALAAIAGDRRRRCRSAVAQCRPGTPDPRDQLLRTDFAGRSRRRSVASRS